jgi:hypothetical protein
MMEAELMDFTTRERILLYLVDQGVGRYVGSVAITSAVRSERSTVRYVLGDMLKDGLLICEDANGSRQKKYALTIKGAEISITQIWRMRMTDQTSIMHLPKARRQTMWKNAGDSIR